MCSVYEYKIHSCPKKFLLYYSVNDICNWSSFFPNWRIPVDDCHAKKLRFHPRVIKNLKRYLRFYIRFKIKLTRKSPEICKNTHIALKLISACTWFNCWMYGFAESTRLPIFLLRHLDQNTLLSFISPAIVLWFILMHSWAQLSLQVVCK